MKIRVCILAIMPFILGACGSTKYQVESGYYQSGRYHAASYQPAYYDAYGHFHPAQSLPGYYQEGRWHRAYVTSLQPQSKVPGGAMTNGTVGVTSRTTVGNIAADDDLSGLRVHH